MSSHHSHIVTCVASLTVLENILLSFREFTPGFVLNRNSSIMVVLPAGRLAFSSNFISYLRSNPFKGTPMKRFVLQAGAWTAFGLVAAFAVVSANSGLRLAATTAVPAAQATVASVTDENCTPSDACCAPETKVAPATFAARKSAPKSQAGAKVVVQTETPAYTSGAVIAIDAETGEFGMPTAVQLAELKGTSEVLPGDLNHSDEGLVDVHHPNGMTTRDLEGRFQDVSMVSVGPNGKLVTSCGQQGHNHTPNVAPSALEEK
jgi:hypothetical protein